MNKKNILIIAGVLLLGAGVWAGITNVEPINNQFDTSKCYLLEPKAFEVSGIHTFGLMTEDVLQIAPELVVLQDPYQAYDPVNNPAVSVNYTQLSTYCLEPFKQMHINLDTISGQVTGLNTRVDALEGAVNDQREITGTTTGLGAALSCNTACNVFDDVPVGSGINFSCAKATSLLGVPSTCSTVLLAQNCVCVQAR